MRKFGAAIGAVALLVTAACGGGGDRPSQDDIAKALKGKVGQKVGLADQASDKQIDCIAKVFEESKISDEGLRALIKGDSDFKPSKSDAKQVDEVTKKIGDCVTP